MTKYGIFVWFPIKRQLYDWSRPIGKRFRAKLSKKQIAERKEYSSKLVKTVLTKMEAEFETKDHHSSTREYYSGTGWAFFYKRIG